MKSNELKVSVEVEYGSRSSIIHLSDSKKKRTSRKYAEMCENLGYMILINDKSKRITDHERMAIKFHTFISKIRKDIRCSKDDIELIRRHVVTKRLDCANTETYYSILVSINKSNVEMVTPHEAWLYLDLLNVPIRIINRLY